jgi:hypothetical protein
MLQPSPLNRNLVPRFTKGGGAQENEEDALAGENRGCWTAERSKTSRSDNFIGYSRWRRIVSSPHAEADPFRWSKNF